MFHFQLKSREERLGDATELQTFLQNLDHFQKWLSDTQTAVASEDTPTSLTEAEKLLSQHAQIREDIDNMAPEYEQLQEFGAKVSVPFLLLLGQDYLKNFSLWLGKAGIML